MAFKMAAAADPNAKLFYNDYNLEAGTNKHAGAMRIVKLVQAYGVKINGVGFQGHLASETTASSGALPSLSVLTKSLQDIANLGVEVAYTELDIRCTVPATSAKLAVAAAAWARAAQSCLNVKQCIGITLWVSCNYLSMKKKSHLLTFLCRAFLTSTLGSRVFSRLKDLRCCGMTTSQRSLLTPHS